MTAVRASRSRFLALVFVALAVSVGCKSPDGEVTIAPVVPPVSANRKAGWILRLEQQRTLRDPGVAALALNAAVPRATSFRPATEADLERLLLDPDPNIRRRAAIAIGRVGSAGGVASLVAGLGDPDDGVRGAVAFALGLLGRRDAFPPLLAALGDSSILVRGKAIEAFGLIADRCTSDPRACGSSPDDAAKAQLASELAGIAGAISRSQTGCAALVAGIEPDDEAWPKSPEIEACRLSWFAMVRLRNYDGLAQLAFDAQGRPVSAWWPLAYALQRINDRRAIPALLTLASNAGVNTPSFALRGLGALKEPQGAAIARGVLGRSDADIKLRIAAIRALGQIGDASSAPVLVTLLNDRSQPHNVRLETVNALGALGSPNTFPALVDLMTDAVPAMRAAAIAAAAKVDPEAFLLVLSGLARDPEWTVRAALASVLSTFEPERVLSALGDFAADDDVRVHGAALDALAAANAPDLAARLTKALASEDFVERGTAARLLGQLRPEGGKAQLIAAYERGLRDQEYGARTGALEGLSKYGDEEAKAVIRTGLGDRDWPVRWRAAQLLRDLGEAQVEPVRPATSRYPDAFFESDDVLNPKFSPHAFIETNRGIVEVELDVVWAPVTSRAFIELARKGFFDGFKIHRVVPTFVVQDGDPRGDGEGGPGFATPDELGSLPYLRGTLGMALEFPDTGGSQWFITLSPQPHLDAKYSAFGRVVNGWDVLDRLSQWDAIERVRIWDGVDFK